ncbi:hypothetical protein RRG08_019181 [Elysia crispata]|uniref:Uncharacterized protein n=1 Tax=Elysia crispata TaxID=231223 RepID=A0AAE0ZXG9_9GAST|nr:hypothetical protein RRG08_019181 [Elysia crispata]
MKKKAGSKQYFIDTPDGKALTPLRPISMKNERSFQRQQREGEKRPENKPVNLKLFHLPKWQAIFHFPENPKRPRDGLSGLRCLPLFARQAEDLAHKWSLARNKPRSSQAWGNTATRSGVQQTTEVVQPSILGGYSQLSPQALSLCADLLTM